MQTYLRFTRPEFKAIARACRPLELTEDSFRSLKPFLIAALQPTKPELAQRIASLRTFQIGIIYQYLKDRREAKPGLRRPAEQAITHEEFGILEEAFRRIRLQTRFLSYARDVLVLQFRQDVPPLAAKLARLSEGQFERLCDRMQQRNRRRS